MFFRYTRDRRFSWLLRIIGVRHDLDGVRVDDGVLTATFGLLGIRTPLSNVAGATLTGPHRWHRSVGPRLSMADHGMTFGTSDRRGVCLSFNTPVPSALGPWDHPGLTVTVEDCLGLIAAIEESR